MINILTFHQSILLFDAQFQPRETLHQIYKLMKHIFITRLKHEGNQLHDAILALFNFFFLIQRSRQRRCRIRIYKVEVEQYPLSRNIRVWSTTTFGESEYNFFFVLIESTAWMMTCASCSAKCVSPDMVV